MLDPGSRLRAAIVAGAWRGLSLAGALSLSHAAVAIAQAVDFAASLNLALVATLLFAIPLMVMSPAQTPAQAVRPPALVTELACLVVATAVGVLGLLLVTLMAGTSEDFYCAPEVPRRLEIAVLGGFALGLLEAMLRLRGRLSTLGPALYLGIFWIAPWYGFFHAPVFLAQLIFYPCGAGALTTMILAVVAMAMAHSIGRRVAVWLFRPQ